MLPVIAFKKDEHKLLLIHLCLILNLSRRTRNHLYTLVFFFSFESIRETYFYYYLALHVYLHTQVVINSFLFLVCPDGRYGEGCKHRCTNCVDKCDDVTGDCQNCTKGWTGQACNRRK